MAVLRERNIRRTEDWRFRDHVDRHAATLSNLTATIP